MVAESRLRAYINEGITFSAALHTMNMSLHEKVMLCFYILLALLYFSSSSTGQPKDDGRAQVKIALHKRDGTGFNIGKAAKTTGYLGGAAELFLRNLYHNYFYEDGQIKAKDFAVSEIIHSVQGIVDAKSKLIRFNVNGINSKEDVQKAEIRIKIFHLPGQDRNSDHLASLGLYDERTGKLISKPVLQGADPTWIVFTLVRSAIPRWFRSPDTIHEVQIKVLTDSKARDTFPDFMICNGTNGEPNGPFMVVYTDGRLLQGVEDSPFLRNRVRRDTGMNRTAARPSCDNLTLCSRHDLHINAKRTFGNLLIAPLSFNAYGCAGRCVVTAAPGSFSNHAMVRSIAAEQWDGDVNLPLPCCVPISFSTNMLGILYSKADGHVVLRQYQNMVATECGCR